LAPGVKKNGVAPSVNWRLNDDGKTAISINDVTSPLACERNLADSVTIKRRPKTHARCGGLQVDRTNEKARICFVSAPPTDVLNVTSDSLSEGAGV
jgi:hypothetical protein